MNAYREPPTTDLFAAYLKAYLRALAGDKPTECEDVRENMAIALANEDAMAARANCDGTRTGDRGEWGFRARREVLEIVETYNKAEPPADEDES